jgi:hypothetical protein
MGDGLVENKIVNRRRRRDKRDIIDNIHKRINELSRIETEK